MDLVLCIWLLPCLYEAAYAVSDPLIAVSCGYKWSENCKYYQPYDLTCLCISSQSLIRLGSYCLHVLKTALMTVSKTFGSFISTTWRLILTDESYSCIMTVGFFFASTESVTNINKSRIYVFMITSLKSSEKTRNSTFCSAGKQRYDTRLIQDSNI